jgi:NADH-quinone oxidoreductase subunit N
MGAAPAIDLSVVAPIGFVALGALVVLLGEVLLSRRQRFLGREVTEVWVGALLATVSTVFLALAVYVSARAFVAGGEAVFNADHPMIQLDRYSAFAMALLGVASLLVCWLSVTYLAELGINHGEYYALVLLATCGMMLLVCSTDLMTLFLGIELMSIPIYVLAGFDRRKLRSNESALKYFVVGSFASALLLYGIALLYGTTGHTDFVGIREAFPPGNPLALVGLGFLIVGFAFKVSSVPFHQWTPDVYEGAPTSVTAYMAVTVKVAAFAALLRTLVVAFGPLSDGLVGLLWVLSALTMVVGNVMAVIQGNLKRLLAYSSIAHAGYVLVGFVTGTVEGYAAVLFYLLVYVFMNLGAFAVIVALATDGRDCENVEDLAGLARSRPGLAALMTVFMLALAGIPGTGGFIAKFMIFQAAVQSGCVGLAIIGVLASVVSVYYYLRIPVMMYMREPGDAPFRGENSSGEWAVLAVCAAVVVLLGIFPNHAPGVLGWVRALDWVRESVALLL